MMQLTNAWNIFLFIAVSAAAMSYGWGMRGTTLGAEKGAMLPGALMGMLIAVFSGSDFLREHFYLLSAIGALGIYFGGSMSYMQSVGLTSDKNPPDDFKRGMTGLFVKGFIWFGLFGSITGMFLSFLTGRYYGDLKTVLLIFGLLPLFALCGSRIFDRPYDEKKGIHPKIYFSRNRPEGMGVLFGILVELILVMAVSKDTVALTLTGGFVLTGSVCWCLAQLLHIKAKYPNKKGKRLFAALQKKGICELWKVNECSMGLFSGIGISVTFTLVVNFSGKYQAFYTDLSLPNLTGLSEWVLPAIFVALLAVDMTRIFINRRKTKEEYEYMLSRGWMSRQELEIALQNPGKEPSKTWLMYERAREVATFPIYCVIPLFFVFLGSAGVAKLVSFYILWHVLVEEQAFNRFNRFKYIWLWRALLMGFGFLVIFAQFYWGWTPNILHTVLLYGVGYEALTLVGNIARKSPDRYNKPAVKESSWAEAYGGQVTMHPYFIFCIAVVTVFAAWVQC
ncbi:MAG: hypothetical protein FWF05_09325 [Oscillospiraceae bacterium]|nr:hypothetical protein [Oscillospiraceae bacterium]